MFGTEKLEQWFYQTVKKFENIVTQCSHVASTSLLPVLNNVVAFTFHASLLLVRHKILLIRHQGGICIFAWHGDADMENIYNGCPRNAAVEASYDHMRSSAVKFLTKV